MSTAKIESGQKQPAAIVFGERENITIFRFVKAER